MKYFNIKFIYFVVFLSLISWSLFAYFTMNSQIHNQEIYAKIINLSGKQRMLSQKTTLIAKRYFESKNENLKIHLKELLDLMNKDHSYIIDNLTSKEITDIYFSEEINLNKKVKNFLELVTLFYEGNNPTLLEQIEQTSFELLPLLDKAVTTFQKESDEKTTELLKREQIILFGTLLTLFLEAIFIVIPSIRISEKKEKELIELNESLTIKIKKAVKENLKKEEQIQQQFHLAQMEEMIINVSHQWRQPLSVISTVASSIEIEKELNQLTDEELSNKINIIMSKVDYLSNTINNFNEFINIDDILEHVNLQQTIEKTLFIIDSSFKENDIKINEEFSQKDIFVKGSGLKLSQSLLSILNNARDFLSTNRSEDRQLSVKTYQKNNSAYIEIEDNAGGIKEENLKKIFDIYFTTKHQSQGTGLGLYITYYIIKNCFKGTIKAQNTEFGAKFIIKLPLAN
jgi:C4-dicarboxylate-specific signal transduction histidine kinase